VYVAMRDEIIEMIGEGPYRKFVDEFESRPVEQLLPHPAVKKRGRNTEG
jgi:hypothetical protein